MSSKFSKANKQQGRRETYIPGKLQKLIHGITFWSSSLLYSDIFKWANQSLAKGFFSLPCPQMEHFKVFPISAITLAMICLENESLQKEPEKR